jgi:glycosyltransferase involved in cell wall biosynthesis
MTAPLISVITANFNSGTKLAGTVASVAGQSVDYEHLIFDGGSTDGSLLQAETLSTADPHIRVFSQPDHGVYDAMNKAIPKAAGRYLYFLGAGDIVRPGSLAAIARYLPEDPCALVYGNVFAFGRVYDGAFTPWKLTASNICHQSAFFGRGVFELCGTFNLKYPVFADWEFNLRCFAEPRVRKLHAPVLVADFEPGGLSYRGDPAFNRDRLRLIRQHLGLGRLALWSARARKLLRSYGP